MNNSRMSVNYSPQAEKELLEIVNYYQECLPGLGDEFIEEFDKQILHCSSSPEIGMLIDNKYRRLVMVRFPFNIIYRIIPDDSLREIQIIAVSHQHRNPEYWKIKPGDNNKFNEPNVEYVIS